MSSHFSPKSLAFYIGAIGFVVALFSITTAYGEAHLRAPSPIDGRYPISTSSLPGCLSDKKLVLTVQQSGIYLTGSLLPEDADERLTRIAGERPSLTGRWDNQQLALDGPLKYLENCEGKVNIQGAVNDKTLTGKVRLEPADSAAGTGAGEADFTAAREAPKPKAQTH